MNERQKQIRHAILNQEVANNERIKMGYSRKDWARLKDFYKAYANKLDSLLTSFIEKYPTDEEEQVLLFEKYDVEWYRFIKPLMNKLKPIPPSKKRVEILTRFQKAVDNWLESDKEEADLPPAKASGDTVVPQGDLIDQILDLYRGYSSYVVLRSYLKETFNDRPVAVIKYLRSQIDHGKGKFEAEAREIMDKYKS